MQRSNLSLLGALAAVPVALPAAAVTFQTQQIAIDGSTQVDAEGIDDAGTIIGNVALGGMGASVGFVQQGSTLAFLNAARPTMITRNGLVTGFTNDETGFLWRNGAFVQGVSFPLGNFNGAPLTPAINRRGQAAYSTASGQTLSVHAGLPGHARLQTGLSDTAIVLSITDDGTLSGYERVTIQGEPRQAVFVGRNGLFDTLLSPYQGNVTGGYSNNAGQVAFTDGTQGYVYAQGTTTSFAVPAPSYGVTVTAINNKGRVAGTYTDSSQTPPVQRVFYANGSQVSVVGSYAQSDIVHVALNDLGYLVVSDTRLSADQVASYRLHCTGPGC
jgi:hypothetical protein